jgi:hypothetical protein
MACELKECLKCKASVGKGTCNLCSGDDKTAELLKLMRDFPGGLKRDELATIGQWDSQAAQGFFEEQGVKSPTARAKLHTLFKSYGGPQPSSPVTFEQLLQKANPRLKPDSHVISRCVSKFASRVSAVMAANLPHDALELYELAKHPGTTTMTELKEKCGISIDGPFSEQVERIFKGNRVNTGAPIIVKIPPMGPASDPTKLVEPFEVRNIKELKLQSQQQSCLVPCEIVTLTVTGTDTRVLKLGQGAFFGIVMPPYPISLAESLCFTPDVYLRGIERIEKAVKYLHEHKYSHNDIKPANMFVDIEGNWWLADFGSCCPFGEVVPSCTDMLYTKKVSKVLKSSPELDWAMLGVSILFIIAGPDKFKEKYFVDKIMHVDKAKIMSGLAELTGEWSKVAQKIGPWLKLLP